MANQAKGMEHLVEQDYLGDGLYVGIDSASQICLFAHNGLYAVEQVYLEPQVLQAFMNYLVRKQIIAKPRE